MTRVEPPVGDPGNLRLDLEPGTVVKCITCHDTEIIGELAAIDLNKKAMILVSAAEPGSKHTHNTVHMLNTANLKHVYVKREPALQKDRPLISLDNQKLGKRVRNQIEEKTNKIHTIGVGVSSEAQSLFNSIRKTIDDVKWVDKTIVVLGDVKISEPYTVKDLQVISGRTSASMEHITKLVKKHYEDKRKPST